MNEIKNNILLLLFITVHSRVYRVEVTSDLKGCLEAKVILLKLSLYSLNFYLQRNPYVAQIFLENNES
jgi:hypothetical protein